MSHEKILFHADVSEKDKERERLREEAAKLIASAEGWESRANDCKAGSEVKAKFLRWARDDRRKAKNLRQRARRLEKK